MSFDFRIEAENRKRGVCTPEMNFRRTERLMRFDQIDYYGYST